MVVAGILYTPMSGELGNGLVEEKVQVGVRPLTKAVRWVQRYCGRRTRQLGKALPWLHLSDHAEQTLEVSMDLANTGPWSASAMAPTPLFHF